MSISFSKMSGTGNDFIVIDNRNHEFSHIINSDFVRKVCSRGMSVGADGLILIENSHNANFKWQFFNSDGTMPDMCGNGARCAARFAYINKMAPKEMTFETKAGIIEGFITDNTEVKVLLTPAHSLNMDLQPLEFEGISYKPYFIDTGVPHVAIFVDDVSSINVNKVGEYIRYHQLFSPKGTNVNFVQVSDNHNIIVRTYERGVEGETLACGTGCTAAALIAIEKGVVNTPSKALTKSGKVLTIYLENKKVYLQGEARLVYTGEINIEAYNY